MDEISTFSELKWLDVVKAMRTYRRGRITHLKTKLEEMLISPLSSHNQSQLSEFKQDISREVKIHLALQNRRDTLLQDKDLTEQEIDDELAATEEVKDLHRDILLQIDTLKTRHSHYQEALIIQNEFDSFMEVSDPDVPEFEKEVAKVQKRLNLNL